MKIRIVGDVHEITEATGLIGEVLDVTYLSRSKRAHKEGAGILRVYMTAELPDPQALVRPPMPEVVHWSVPRNVPAAEIRRTDLLLVPGHSWEVVTRVWPEPGAITEAVWVWTAPHVPRHQLILHPTRQVRLHKLRSGDPDVVPGPEDYAGREDPEDGRALPEGVQGIQVRRDAEGGEPR